MTACGACARRAGWPSAPICERRLESQCVRALFVQAVFALTRLRLLAVRASGLRKVQCPLLPTRNPASHKPAHPKGLTGCNTSSIPAGVEGSIALFVGVFPGLQRKQSPTHTRQVSPEVAGLPELRRLDVARNRDLEVSAAVPWERLAELRSLDLSECRHLRVRRTPPPCPAPLAGLLTHSLPPGQPHSLPGQGRLAACMHASWQPIVRAPPLCIQAWRLVRTQRQVPGKAMRGPHGAFLYWQQECVQDVCHHAAI